MPAGAGLLVTAPAAEPRPGATGRLWTNMLDTLEITRTLTGTGLKPEQAAAITHALLQAADDGRHVTPEQFQAGLAGLRAEAAEHRSELRGEMAGLRGEMAELRSDVAELRTGTAQLRGGMAEVRTETAELRGEMADSRAGMAELRAGMAELRAEISGAESRIIKWVVGIVLSGAGIVTAAGVTLGLAILRALGALAGSQ